MGNPIWIIVGFQQREKQDSQILNTDTFFRRPVTSAQSIFGTGKFPDSAFPKNYDDDNYSQRYGQIKEVFRAPTKYDILIRYITDHDFRSSNEGKNIGYNFYVFDIQYRKNIESAQPIKAEFKFSENILAGIYVYALVSTFILVFISSEGQRHFDLI